MCVYVVCAVHSTIKEGYNLIIVCHIIFALDIKMAHGSIVQIIFPDRVLDPPCPLDDCLDLNNLHCTIGNQVELGGRHSLRS